MDVVGDAELVGDAPIDFCMTCKARSDAFTLLATPLRTHDVRRLVSGGAVQPSSEERVFAQTSSLSGHGNKNLLYDVLRELRIPTNATEGR